MKKIFQIGAGLVGKTMAHDLSKNFELYLADNNLNLLKGIKSELSHIHINHLDVTDTKSLVNGLSQLILFYLLFRAF